jgi:lactoylglutathione lyase
MSAKSFKCEIDDYKSWVSRLNASKPQFLHMTVRITDIDASLRFYVDGLGMKLLGHFDVEERCVTALFLGFEVGATAVELTHYWNDSASGLAGPDYFAIGVPDVHETFARLEAMGAEVVVRPRKVLADWPCVAFVKDPDGYKVELIQTRNS